MSARVGLGFDVHPFGGDGALVLGGITVPGPGLAGHSDGDVVVHAVADALLGATGLPDLGTRFPASDDRYRGVSSMALLADVVEAVVDTGWWVANVDVVVAAETPTLAPYVDAMADAVADALSPARQPLGRGISVRITPKRAEGLGAIGRAEGIAAWAVTLVERA